MNKFDKEEVTELFREKVKIMISNLSQCEVKTDIAIGVLKMSLDSLRKELNKFK